MIKTERVILFIAFIVSLALVGITASLIEKVSNLESENEKINNYLNRIHIGIDQENDCWYIEWWSHVDTEFADKVPLGDLCGYD